VDSAGCGDDDLGMPRTRLVAPLLAVAVALAIATVAYARSYDVPGSLGSTLDRTRAKAGLAILLPSRLALDYDGRLHASGGGDRRSYELALDAAPNCGGADACLLASFSAQRGGTPAFRTKVALRGGRTGYYKALSCGGSCSPPEIQWRSRGNLYSIQAKVGASASASQRRALVTAANSAIGAGPR
jgi:hypothetical protein